MLLRQLKYFIAIVEEGNFTEAAYKCNISQSAISQQIQALERDLGVELFKREGRSFSLTVAGEYFYNHGKSLDGIAEDLIRETKRLGEDDELSLKIGYPLNYAAEELYQAVAWFSSIYPEVSISITRASHEGLYNKLRTFDLDIVLNDQRRAFSDEYENFELLKAECYVEISSSNKLSTKTIVDITELKQIPCILITNDAERESEMEYFKTTLGFGESFLFASSIEEARLMAVSNRGFFPIDKAGTLPSVGSASKRIAIYKNEEPLLINYCLFWKKKRSNYYIEEFANGLKNILKPTTLQ